MSGTKLFWAGAADTDDVSETECDAPTCNNSGPDSGGGPRDSSLIVGSYPTVAKAMSDQAAVMFWVNSQAP